jgi:hypothetical protein
LEWDYHAVTKTNVAEGITHSNNFANHLMAHHKRSWHRVQTKRNGRV